MSKSVTAPMPSQRGHMPPSRLKVAFLVCVLAPRSTVIPPLARTDATLKANALGGPICGCPSRLKRMRSIAPVSVAVPTVDRASPPIRCWSTLIAVVRPSSTSTSGRANVGMKPCRKALYVSLISRCDSAAIVPNTSELLPEPETPVNTVSRRFGISMLTSLRLFSRAPCTRIRSWLSAACRSPSVALLMVLFLPFFDSFEHYDDAHASGQLLDADHVARGVEEGTVPNAVRLLDRLLDHLGAGLEPFEDGVEVGGGEQEVGVVVRRVQHDRGLGLPDGADRDPARPVAADVGADLEAQCVPVEGQGRLRVVVREEARPNRDVHGRHASHGPRPALLGS